MLDAYYIPYFVLVVAFAAFAQGFTGLGCGIIAMAGVAFTPWDLERASVVTNLLLVALNCTIIFAGRKEARIDLKLAGVILAGEIAGVPLGYWFIYAFGNRQVFRVALGMTLLLFALHALLRPRIRHRLHLSLGTVAGVVGGFFAGAFTAGGPFLALFIYSRYENPADAKGTLQIVLMSATLWRLLNIVFFGRGLSQDVVGIASVSILPVIICAGVGHLFARRFTSAAFLKVVYSFIGVAGVLNIVKGIQ
jgi:hypothetical protein